MERARLEAAPDAHIPLFHACSGVQWLNDPNGVIVHEGKIHVFYQCNPYGVEWGTIHWGHMVSEDWLHWQHAPIALAPSAPYDRDGCFSGSAVVRDGQFELYYTGNVFITPEGLPDGLLQQQCVAVSDDGIVFHKRADNPIICAPPEHVGQTNHFRDPKVWVDRGIGYMVLGTKKDNKGKVVLYRTHDWTHWEFVSTLTESDGTMGHMYECPDLFLLHDETVLIFCPEGALVEPSPRCAGYVIGQLRFIDGAFVHGPFCKLDHGFDFYAPQSVLDAHGRRIVIGWMTMNGKALGKSWAGCMSMPRVLTTRGDGVLRQHPIEELRALRDREFVVRDYVVDADSAMLLTAQCGNCFELIVTIDLIDTDAAIVELHLCSDESGTQKTVIRYDRTRHEVAFDRTHANGPIDGWNRNFGEDDQQGFAALHVDATMGISASEHTEDVPLWDRVRTYRVQEKHAVALTWHIFFDRCTLELFIQDGEAVMSGLVFPHPDAQLCKWVSIGGKTAIRDMRYYALRDPKTI
jgi:beta-fructofuranosidase